MKDKIKGFLSSVNIFSGRLTRERALKQIEELGISKFPCCYLDEPDKLKLLLAAQVPLDSEDILGKAIYRGHYESAALLLSVPGINVNATYISATPLQWAVEKRQVALVAMLLSSFGIDVNATGDIHDDTPVCIAAESGQTEILALLLSVSGVDVNKTGRTRFGRPLYRAAANGRVDCVKLLLKARNISISDDDISVAYRNGHTLCGQLIEAEKNSLLNKLRRVRDFFN